MLPRGRVWHRGWGWLQAQTLLTLMPPWARLDARADHLLTDAFPCSTVELLPEWEATLGLPDPCAGPLATLQQRTAAVCTKFRARGGQSIEYFVELAASLGYTIRIETFAPFRASMNRIGEPLYDEAWAFAWRVILQPVDLNLTYFRAGLSAAGEPLADWGDELLECIIREGAPAHTIPIFVYEGASDWDAGVSIWDAGESPWDHTATPPPLDILWQGHRWAVTATGIDRLDRSISIAVADLADDTALPLDDAEFRTAWLVAVALHRAPATTEQMARATRR